MPELGIGPPIHLTDVILTEIARIGELRQPAEACGVLLIHPRVDWDARTQVVEIANRSMHAQDSYELKVLDIRLELAEWMLGKEPEEIGTISIWHTHPKGNVGPSPGDLKSKDPSISYLVVALTLDGPVPTWF